MGRIKTTPVKRATRKIFGEHKDRFTEDFDKNKKIVSELIETPSKKIRNMIAGYATRLVTIEKKKKE